MVSGRPNCLRFAGRRLGLGNGNSRVRVVNLALCGGAAASAAGVPCIEVLRGVSKGARRIHTRRGRFLRVPMRVGRVLMNIDIFRSGRHLERLKVANFVSTPEANQATYT